MKTYDEILEGLCQQHYGMSFLECCEQIVFKGLKTIAKHAAHEYAKQCAQDALNRAAENAKTKRESDGLLDYLVIDKELIKNTEIITP